MTSKRRDRQTMPEVWVPYLRMSGRWLEEHGFAIGTCVQVLVEHGRVTLISEAVEQAGDSQSHAHRAAPQGGSIVHDVHEQDGAHLIEDRVQDAASGEDE